MQKNTTQALILSKSDFVASPQIVNIGETAKVFSYGSDWVAEVEEPTGGISANILNKNGALVVSQQGLHIVCNHFSQTARAYQEGYYCLEREGLVDLGDELPTGKLAFLKWSISLIDESLGKSF